MGKSELAKQLLFKLVDLSTENDGTFGEASYDRKDGVESIYTYDHYFEVWKIVDGKLSWIKDDYEDLRFPCPLCGTYSHSNIDDPEGELREYMKTTAFKNEGGTNDYGETREKFRERMKYNIHESNEKERSRRVLLDSLQPRVSGVDVESIPIDPTFYALALQCIEKNGWFRLDASETFMTTASNREEETDVCVAGFMRGDVLEIRSFKYNDYWFDVQYCPTNDEKMGVYCSDHQSFIIDQKNLPTIPIRPGKIETRYFIDDEAVFVEESLETVLEKIKH